MNYCDACKQGWDRDTQYGACPHDRYPQDTIDQIRFNREHPSYCLKHAHDFNGNVVNHVHYVNRGVEWDERYHRHPIIAARYSVATHSQHVHRCECGETWQ